jgi:hypothetical protein
MTAPANDPVTLVVTLVRDEPLQLFVANAKRPKGEFIARALVIDMTREAEDGTASLTIARKLAETRGLV